MFMIRPATVAVAAALTLSGCGVASAMKPSPERDADTDFLVSDVAAGRTEAVIGKMSSQASPYQVRAQMPFLRTLVPAGSVPEGKTVGWQAFTGTGGTTYTLQRAYEYPDRTLGVTATWRKEGEVWKALNFNINVQVKSGATTPQNDEIPVAKAGERAPDA